MVQVLNKGATEEVSRGILEKDVPVVAGTVIQDAKSFLVKQACHNCFKWVNETRLSDVARQLPICPECEEKRRRNLSADLRKGTINTRVKEGTKPVSGA